ncbi:MAG: LacI family DNA-binding transcriptional regulator [Anaerolineales bacterium]|nr:LacI family DNA-binding transcriptional regulator [Anaerolineales bacterium]
MPTKKNATIRDVARLANVSVATISRILNDKPDVSEETRQKAIKVMNKLGYARNTQWKRITSGKTRVITLHYPYMMLAVSNQVSLHFITGATTACEEHNYSLHLATQSLDENSLLDFYRTKQSDGVILMEIQMDDWRVKLLRRNNLPFVMIGRCEDNNGVNFVDFDFESAATVAVGHLIELGHRNIGFISVASAPQRNHYGPSVRAAEGYEKVCAQYKIPKLYCKAESGFENVKFATLNLLKKHPEITAIVTVFDTAVAGIYSAIKSLGLNIPDDISVIGLADEQGAQMTSPSLTTLHFPASSMGYDAATIMINALEKNTKTSKQVLVGPKLVIHSSTGYVRKTA